MYSKNPTNSSHNKTESNVFVNKHPNNRKNNLIKENCNLGDSSKQNRQNQSSSGEENINTTPYQRVQKIPPVFTRSTIGNGVKEKKEDLNASCDQILKESRTFPVDDDNKITFGKAVNKHKRTTSMDNKVGNYDRMICNNCLNTQLKIVKSQNLKNEEPQGNFDGNNAFHVRIEIY